MSFFEVLLQFVVAFLFCTTPVPQDPGVTQDPAYVQGIDNVSVYFCLKMEMPQLPEMSFVEDAQ